MKYIMSRLSEQQILARARASSLENVKNLNFWGSDVNDISVLRQMPNVEVLSLSVNSITSLKDFAHCPRLRELYLRRNSIGDIDEIGFLKNLPKLRVLWLSDNPCANIENYRMTVLRNLPKLTKLDTVVVEEAEVFEASKQGQEIPTPEDIPFYHDFTATADKNTLKMDVARDDSPQIFTENDKSEPSHDNLVNETNKLRAQLGLKPLLLDDHANTTTAMTTTSVEKKASGNSSDSRNQNIVSAVRILVQDLDETSLLTLRNEIDQRLQSLNKTYSESKNSHEQLEEKELITD